MRALALSAALWGMGACSSGPPAPVDPVWGKQACEHCAMLISEPPPSAQAIHQDGTRRFFDDVGCLAAWLERSPEAPSAMWVRTPENDGWTNALTARYGAGNVTPMDFGFLPKREGATFEEMRAAVKRKTETRPGGAP